MAGFRFKHNANSDTQTVSLTERCLVKALPFKTSYSAVFFYFTFFKRFIYLQTFANRSCLPVELIERESFFQ